MKKSLTLLALTIAISMNAQFNTNYGIQLLITLLQVPTILHLDINLSFPIPKGNTILHMEHYL